MCEQAILHEYSHKALFTVDYAVETPKPGGEDGAWLVYGQKDCQYLATQNVEDTMRNADCWGYFLCSFTAVYINDIFKSPLIFTEPRWFCD